MFCRQRQDEKLRRGGEQKSVVILSEQPYSSALIPLAQYAGPLYFNIGQTAMEEVKLIVLVTLWKYQAVHCMKVYFMHTDPVYSQPASVTKHFNKNVVELPSQEAQAKLTATLHADNRTFVCLILGHEHS